MAGWSMIADDKCGLDCSKTPLAKLELKGLLLGLDPFSRLSSLTDERDSKLRCQFDNCLKSFRKEICALDVAFPPMLGNGQSVDLLKLFLVVRERGGYDAVCKNALWDVVAEESGLGLNLSSSLKLVYVKYLDALEKGLRELVVKDSITKLSDSSSTVVGDSKDLDSKELSEVPEWKSAPNTIADMNWNGCKKSTIDDEESVHLGPRNSAVSVEIENLDCDVPKSSAVDSFSDGYKNSGDFQDLQSNLTNVKIGNEVTTLAVEMDESKKCDNGDENGVVLDSDTVEESISSRKRKRESTCRMLNWVSGVARNPCDDVVDSLPDMSEWESYANEELWKQVLIVREALFFKRHVDFGAEQSCGKKYRKMHPSMYDDQTGSTYNFRERLKCSDKLLHGRTQFKARGRPHLSSPTTDSDSCTKGIGDGDSSSKHALLDLPVEKPIPLGPDFQAEVPEWTGVISKSDSKWVGRKVWPPEKVDNRFVVEREPIGKGRQDSCGCEKPKSVECVRFHVNERRSRVKHELGISFHLWRFDKMGEDVKHSWTVEEEKKFKAVVQLNPPSLDKCFWDEIFKVFPKKRREDLVSYYFNVFLLQRRALQNRFTPNNIDSDDDESECGSGTKTNSSKHEAPKSPGSLLCSAKKSRKDGR